MVDTRALRIVFFGTPDFAVPTLEALLGSSHRVVGVVTQPDRPRGRGQKVSDAPVKARASTAGLPVLQPARLSDAGFLHDLTAFEADLGVVAAYGKILTDAVLAIPRHGLLNVHASLLPKYRGAAPVHRAVINGDPITGVTIIRVVKALDAGPMLASRERPIGPEDTSQDVERDLAVVGASLLVEVVDDLVGGSLRPVEQEERAATYAPRLTRADGVIDWTCSPLAIHNLIRGLHPWPHAHTFYRGGRLIIRRSQVGSRRDGSSSGTILDAGECLEVAAGGGVLRITEIQEEGGRPLTASQFLAGHRLVAGERLTSRP